MQLPDFLVEDAHGFIHVAGHRIGLAQLVHDYNEGYSAEILASEFPTLSLPLVHKVIAFYLENRAEVNRYVTQHEGEIQRQRNVAMPGPAIVELRKLLAG